MIFGINTTSDISKLLYVISRAVKRVKFETVLKYHEWYLCQISRTNHASVCLYYPQKVVIFTCRYFKLSWNTAALSRSNCRHCSRRSINVIRIHGNQAWCLRKITSKINKKLTKSSVLTNHSGGSLLHKHKTIQFDEVEERPLKCIKLNRL